MMDSDDVRISETETTEPISTPTPITREEWAIYTGFGSEEFQENKYEWGLEEVDEAVKIKTSQVPIGTRRPEARSHGFRRAEALQNMTPSIPTYESTEYVQQTSSMTPAQIAHSTPMPTNAEEWSNLLNRLEAATEPAGKRWEKTVAKIEAAAIKDAEAS